MPCGISQTKSSHCYAFPAAFLVLNVWEMAEVIITTTRTTETSTEADPMMEAEAEAVMEAEAEAVMEAVVEAEAVMSDGGGGR